MTSSKGFFYQLQGATPAPFYGLLPTSTQILSPITTHFDGLQYVICSESATVDENANYIHFVPDANIPFDYTEVVDDTREFITELPQTSPSAASSVASSATLTAIDELSSPESTPPSSPKPIVPPLDSDELRRVREAVQKATTSQNLRRSFSTTSSSTVPNSQAAPKSASTIIDSSRSHYRSANSFAWPPQPVSSSFNSLLPSSGSVSPLSHISPSVNYKFFAQCNMSTGAPDLDAQQACSAATSDLLNDEFHEPLLKTNSTSMEAVNGPSSSNDKPHRSKSLDEEKSAPSSLTTSDNIKRILENAQKAVLANVTAGVHNDNTLADDDCNRQGEENLRCEICSKKFKSKQTLVRHMRLSHESHGEKGALVCKVCKKSFAFKHLLREHEAQHLSRIWECSVCRKQLATRSSLTQHERQHRLPFACHLCHNRFDEQSKLAEHVRAHPQVLMRCSYCSFLTEDQQLMSTHLLTHPGAMGDDDDNADDDDYEEEENVSSVEVDSGVSSSGSLEQSGNSVPRPAAAPLNVSPRHAATAVQRNADAPPDSSEVSTPTAADSTVTTSQSATSQPSPDTTTTSTDALPSQQHSAGAAIQSPQTAQTGQLHPEQSVAYSYSQPVMPNGQPPPAGFPQYQQQGYSNQMYGYLHPQYRPLMDRYGRVIHQPHPASGQFQAPFPIYQGQPYAPQMVQHHPSPHHHAPQYHYQQISAHNQMQLHQQHIIPQPKQHLSPGNFQRPRPESGADNNVDPVVATSSNAAVVPLSSFNSGGASLYITERPMIDGRVIPRSVVPLHPASFVPGGPLVAAGPGGVGGQPTRPDALPTPAFVANEQQTALQSAMATAGVDEMQPPVKKKRRSSVKKKDRLAAATTSSQPPDLMSPSSSVSSLPNGTPTTSVASSTGVSLSRTPSMKDMTGVRVPFMAQHAVIIEQQRKVHEWMASQDGGGGAVTMLSPGSNDSSLIPASQPSTPQTAPADQAADNYGKPNSCPQSEPVTSPTVAPPTAASDSATSAPSSVRPDEQHPSPAKPHSDLVEASASSIKSKSSSNLLQLAVSQSGIGADDSQHLASSMQNAVQQPHQFTRPVYPPQRVPAGPGFIGYPYPPAQHVIVRHGVPDAGVSHHSPRHPALASTLQTTNPQSLHIAATPAQLMAYQQQLGVVFHPGTTLYQITTYLQQNPHLQMRANQLHGRTMMPPPPLFAHHHQQQAHGVAEIVAKDEPALVQSADQPPVLTKVSPPAQDSTPIADEKPKKKAKAPRKPSSRKRKESKELAPPPPRLLDDVNGGAPQMRTYAENSFLAAAAAAAAKVTTSSSQQPYSDPSDAEFASYERFISHDDDESGDVMLAEFGDDIGDGLMLGHDDHHLDDGRGENTTDQNLLDGGGLMEHAVTNDVLLTDFAADMIEMNDVVERDSAPPSAPRVATTIDVEATLAPLFRAGKLFRCEWCTSLLFTERALYIIHRALHMAGDPFRCSVCERRCSDRHEFSLHLVNDHTHS